MDPGGRFGSKSFPQDKLDSGRFKKVSATNDLRYTISNVIRHHRECVANQPVSSNQNGILVCC